jgi:hypothetical protein
MMKTDHYEDLRISSKFGGDVATWKRPEIVGVKGGTKEANMLSGERLKKVPLVREGNEKTEEEVGVLLAQTSDTLRKYLQSWVFRDIGPVTARNIVSAFGPKTVQVIMRSPHELMNVKGVGRKRMLAVLNGWTFQRRLIKGTLELIKLTSSDQ